PDDSSNSSFTISSPVIAASPAPVAFGTHPIGSSTLLPITIQNNGNLSLSISSISVGSAAYSVGHTSLGLAPGNSDTVGVTFTPPGIGSWPDTVVIVSNGQSPLRVPITAAAIDTISVDVATPNGGEEWNWNTVHALTWNASANAGNVALEYRTDPAGPWKPIVASIATSPGFNSYAWSVPFDTTS